MSLIRQSNRKIIYKKITILIISVVYAQTDIDIKSLPKTLGQKSYCCQKCQFIRKYLNTSAS